MIDLQALRSLVAIERHGSVVAAADVLGFTPSAISQQVKKLERTLDAELLERQGRGVILTERGRLLVAEGGPLLRELERVTTLLESPVLAKRKLRVIAFSTAMRGLVAPALARYQSSGAHHAPLETQLRSVEPEAAVDQVARGDADLAVVHNWSSIPLAIPAGVRAEVLGVDEADVVLSVNHRLAARPSVDRSELIGEPWAATPSGAICNEALMRLFADLGVVPRVVAEDPEFATLISLASAGVAIALVPRLGRGPLGPSVVARPLRDAAQRRTIQVVYRESMANSPAVKELAGILREVFAQTPGLASEGSSADPADLPAPSVPSAPRP
ncbi:LysR family transcriptional regulator [Paeniglutamicibacter sp. MACA_103]|uniref:LysR family transcriptional regulator n=1 Tax=Paeniglutamicibacter sp. MACA_103 TaxID=3377337 RepID=UPI0038939A2A